MYQHYSSWLYSLCIRYSANHDDAQDALQESFINIFRSLHQYSRTSNFKAWIKRIAIHTSLAQHKKKNAKIYSQMTNEITENDFIHTDFISELDADEILFYINKLSPGRKQIFNAYYVEGYSHREIAELLGISEGTSKSQLHDAKKELKLALERNTSIAKKQAL
ncbi:MAG TPA: RNA polymerase sigma factor [Fluviicola sp.]|nr:RNA polymerase sigma factor [Fluviicola sp.]